jgi:ATP synthase, F1 epsilon subunit (delta in mitochondria)
MPFEVQLVSPERVLYEGEADMVVCRTTDGEIAFLPGHVPLVGALGVAKVRIILPEKGEIAAAVHGGFVEVSGDHVTILSDVAELPGQVDIVRAQTAKENAQQRVEADAADEDAQAALARAELRLEVAAAG